MGNPPHLLLWLLGVILPNREDEPIVGDLLETYHLSRASARSEFSAGAKLFMDVLSFIPARLFEGRWPVRPLALVSVLTLFAGLWLAYMEQVLSHPGHGARSAVDLILVLGSLLILAWTIRRDRGWLRAVIALYAVAAIVFGTWTLVRILRATHFEGFVLIIATALCLQGLLALAGIVRLRMPRTP